MKNSNVQVSGKFKAVKTLAFISIQMFILSFSSNGFSQSGCLPTFQYNADGNMITQVQFGTISNTSPFTSGTTPVYEDFTSISTDVTIGQTYTISIKGPSSTFPSDVTVFIDWNQNGLFDEAGTYIGLISPANPANAVTITAPITVPVSALTGSTKLRIVKNTNVNALGNPAAPSTISTACDQNLRAGQTEDYSLNVLPAAINCSGDPGPNPGDLGCITLTYKGVSTQYTTVRAADGNVWMQQNLGSGQIATASNDAASYGDLFQWGRWDDGHQSRTSTLSTLAPAPNNPTGLAANTEFLNSTPVWWDAAALSDTWQAETPNDVTTTNGCDPCKALGNEWHLPSSDEWQAVITAESMTNILSAFQSNLKLATGGTRNASGTFDFVGQRGYYWSNTTSSSGGKMLYYSNFIVNPNAGYPRRQGGAIRCLKALPVPAVASIDVVTQNNVPATITTNAGTLQVEAIVLPAGAIQDVTWSIINGTGTASISTTGLVTAQTNGTIWTKAVSVANTAIKDSLLITISGQVVLVQGIDVFTQNNVPAVITTNAGTLQVEAIILPANATNQNVIWSIVNGTGTASISTTGLVTAQTNGTIWAKAVSAGNTALKDSIMITLSGQAIPVLAIDVITQNNAPAAITTNGGTLQVQALFLPANATNQNVNWSIVNGTGTASISANGLISAQTNGTIWAKAVSAGNPTIKDSLLITISGQFGLSVTEDVLSAMEIYPNPAQTAIYVQLNQNHAAVNLKLSDSKGSIVYESKVAENELFEGLKIDVTNLQPGVYYLHLNSVDFQTVKKVIKE
ncbi:Bacterial Ig-like domain (group 2) [compost metagenome]